MSMSSSPSAPPAPDPVATANAQAIYNQDTATTQQLLNMTNQVTPDGSLTYKQNGNNTFTDANGVVHTVPKFTATTALSPGQQAIYDTNQATQQNIATIGKDQSGRIGDLLGTPFKVDQAISDKIDQLGATRLDPQFARSEDALRTKLTNQGIQPGSQAWNAEMTQFQQGKNDAYNSLYLSGDQQAEQESLAERNQPINEITALMSGSQVSNPTFQNTPNTNVAGEDYMGAVNNNYNAAVQQQGIQTSQQNALMGGLFGLGGTLGGMGIYKYSDRRMKKNIRRVGRLDNGLPVHLYEYKSGGPVEVGLMADEVEAIHPHAVIADAAGRKMVNYAEAVR